jgi:hypothetical protein
LIYVNLKNAKCEKLHWVSEWRGLHSEWSAIMAICKACLTFAAAVLGFGLLIGPASVMPANSLSVASSQGTNEFQN